MRDYLTVRVAVVPDRDVGTLVGHVWSVFAPRPSGHQLDSEWAARDRNRTFSVTAASADSCHVGARRDVDGEGGVKGIR